MKMSHRTRRAPRRDPRPGAVVYQDGRLVTRRGMGSFMFSTWSLPSRWILDALDKGAKPQPYQHEWMDSIVQQVVPRESFELQPGSTDMNSVWLDPNIGCLRIRKISRAEYEREYLTDRGPAPPLAPRNDSTG